ncbi:NAD-dependent epimerase/dehydratase family protein, partial [Candidatus Thorarchaeota archaeon]
YSPYSGVISIFINQALSGEPITVNGDGKQTRSMIFVGDVARATTRAGEVTEAHGKTINIGGTDEITILELAEKVKDLMPDTSSHIVHTEARTGDIRQSIASTELARKVLSFKPQVSLEEGLKRTIDWYRLNPQDLTM